MGDRTLIPSAFRTSEPANALFLSGDDPRGRPRAFSASVLDEAHMPAFNAALDEMTAKAIEHSGVEAMLSPKRETALHEAGHAVFYAAMGVEVASVSIYRFSDPQHVAMESTLGVAEGFWGGAIHAPRPWNWGSCAPPEEDLLSAQDLIAGWCGEWAHDLRGLRGARRGSSLDELLLAQMALAHAARKTGAAQEVLFIEQLKTVVGVLRANRAAHEALAARLMRKSTIGPNALKQFLKDVRAPASSARQSATLMRSEGFDHA
jgi:hypothetical protein